MVKFEVGDKVCLNNRIPHFIELQQNRPRTVVAINYNPQHRCAYYILGSNGRGTCSGEPASFGFSCYRFRSYMLSSWPLYQKRGRPKKE